MSVGGRIIENAPYQPKDGQPALRRLWVMDQDGTETAVLAEPAAEVLKPGEEIWWQSGTIYARKDTMKLKKIAYSFDPRGPKRESGG